MKRLFIIIPLITIPIINFLLPEWLNLVDPLKNIFIFMILGLGLHILSGTTGLLSLGIAGFMAIGSYTYAISTSLIYPFQLSFITALILSMIIGGFAGLVVGLPTLRLKGDYLAIVTLGFGEIIQDILRNVDVITKGTQGINPLAAPSILGIEFTRDSPVKWYYLLLSILAVVYWITGNIENSRIGRALLAIREDELAASSIGHSPFKIKVLSFALSSSIAALAGAVWAMYLGSSGEPGNFDFNISALALCIIIVGGIGSRDGVIIGTIVMVGLNSVLLSKLSQLLNNIGYSSTQSVFLSPNNYKYLLFGLALILMMRIKPEGIIGSKQK